MYFFTTNDIADVANSNTIENFIVEVTVTKLLELQFKLKNLNYQTEASQAHQQHLAVQSLASYHVHIQL